jgi:hypothetical protein
MRDGETAVCRSETRIQQCMNDNNAIFMICAQFVTLFKCILLHLFLWYLFAGPFSVEERQVSTGTKR